jgi:hypothetical protein
LRIPKTSLHHPEGKEGRGESKCNSLKSSSEPFREVLRHYPNFPLALGIKRRFGGFYELEAVNRGHKKDTRPP